jgi:FixJ family two-component response regulator
MRSNQLHIAIVEDHAILRESLATLLDSCGYQATTFSSGEAFIAAAAGCRVDCIVLDIELGTCTGFDVAAHPDVAGLGTPLIFMTGSSDPGFPVKAAEAGGAAFLRKPFPASLFIEMLARAVRPADLQRSG